MPAPTSWWEDSEPERAVAAAKGVRLAVTAVLQALPPRQRGVFILRDVLGRSAAETAAVLELSVTAVNSALQRARAAVRGQASRPAPLRRETVEDYARAIERADAVALAALVAADVVFEMPPVRQWSTGLIPTPRSWPACSRGAARGGQRGRSPRTGFQLDVLVYAFTLPGDRPRCRRETDARLSEPPGNRADLAFWRQFEAPELIDVRLLVHGLVADLDCRRRQCLRHGLAAVPGLNPEIYRRTSLPTAAACGH